MIPDFLTALRTLTVLPVPGPEGDFGRSFFYFPLVGGLLACILWGVLISLNMLIPGHSLLVSLIGIGLISWLTGFLHLDGLADTADAFGGGRSPEDILRILKDSRIGSIGAAVLFFDLLAKVLLYSALLKENHINLIAASVILSRAVQPLFFVHLPYARGPEGKSYGFSQAKGLRTFLTIEFFALAIGLLFWMGPKTGVVAPAAAIGGCVAAGFRFHRGIGGITGDCVGASSEIFEILFLIGALATL